RTRKDLALQCRRGDVLLDLPQQLQVVSIRGLELEGLAVTELVLAPLTVDVALLERCHPTFECFRRARAQRGVTHSCLGCLGDLQAPLVRILVASKVYGLTLPMSDIH